VVLSGEFYKTAAKHEKSFASHYHFAFLITIQLTSRASLRLIVMQMEVHAHDEGCD